MEVLITNTDLCVGCNKCIANCPVKANFAFIEKGKNVIKVDRDRCIHCGKCIDACDHNVRDYIDDTKLFLNDLINGLKVSLIVSPEIKFNFPQYKNLFGYLKNLGVNLIFDTDFGEDIYFWGYLKMLREDESLISPKCPVVINYIEKHYASLIPQLAKIQSPMMCSAVYLQKYFKLDDELAFLSTCIGKIDEIHDQKISVLKYNVTLAKIEEYLVENKIDIEKFPKEDFSKVSIGIDDIVTNPGRIRDNTECVNMNFWIKQTEEIKYVCNYLDEYYKRNLASKVIPNILDVINCKNGCFLGTGVKKNIDIDDIENNINKFKLGKFNNDINIQFNKLDRQLNIADFKREYIDKTNFLKYPSELEINDVFIKLHKDNMDSQTINCYSCGYGSCREFAKAVAKGDNYLNNCIEYNRKELISKNKDLFNSTKEAVQLKHIATHDLLTNIPNRYFLQNYISKLLSSFDKNNTNSALIFIDIDNFKVVNDSFGHLIGDEVLLKVVDRFRRNLDNETILARLGGDEFAVLVKNSTFDKTEKLATKLLNDLRNEKFVVGTNNFELHITASFGITVIDGTLTSQEVLAYADTALYSAKDTGKNRIMTIKDTRDKKLFSEANRIIMKINNALQNDGFIFHAQPIFSINKDITHYEILLRILDETGKLIFPNEFIGIAEKFGLMSEIDKWVVKKVVGLMEQNKNLSLFVNLSGYSLSDSDLLNYIETLIKESEFEKKKLGFEITETTTIKDFAKAELWINSIKKLGCKFALDDFGVGFSSFEYLQKIPADYLKIDGSFIRNLDIDFTQRALVQSMNEVAHACGKKTIAEYVENEKIWEILKELKIDYGQGYYLGKPAPL